MLIFNPKYILLNDVYRILILSKPQFMGREVKAYIHPVYAWILNLFDGHTSMIEAEKKVMQTLHLTKDEANRVIHPLIENRQDVHIRYNGVISSFPAQVLIHADGHFRKRKDDSFFMSVQGPDHERLRLYRPVSMLLCPTLKCYTDCIYCYANRHHPHQELDAEFWTGLVRQARKENIVRVDVTGGEFFLKKGWKQITRTLVENGYYPDISTKIPLDYKTIDEIKDCGLKTLQFSLDTLDAQVAVETLKVNSSYVERIMDTIRYADNIGLNVILKPTLCNKTCTVDNVQAIMKFADTLQHVDRVVVTAIGFSCYKPRDCYARIRPSIQQVEQMRNFIDRMADEKNYPIKDDTFVYVSEDMKNTSVFDARAHCTGNMDGFVVLPDGQVTICEELYWHPYFLIGNLASMSIQQVWQSSKALKLAALDQMEMPSGSACSKCSTFKECRSGAGVCWKLVVAAYGEDNPLYPDPRCPQAGDTDLSFIIR